MQMATYNIGFALYFDGDSDLEPVFDLLADAAADLSEDDHGYIDADVSGTLGERLLELTLSMEDSDEDRVVARGMAAGRTIIHAAGGPTPGWDKLTVERDFAPC
ncbi:hypothetical protein GMA1_32 [Gordonia phage GMA1]|uniref:hypothetical protein n=1 Tax=Gordonia phage GMA1 TaxID=1647470 RepID=UPI0007B64AA7|nr:hypothetical protein BH788_gp32 [Gordonia phage GMA1]AKJ72129.1 hypothetical protein GMA1_32 [Gordonia phage GMA1]